jgi:hypothetical protein
MGDYTPPPRLGSPQHNRAPGSPDEVVDVGVGDNHGLVVNLGRMLIEGEGGLGAEVTVPVVEIERTNALFAADTLELHFLLIRLMV